MKALALFLALSAPGAHAALDIKPGLWEVRLKLIGKGKEIDPQAELQKALENMNPEQRKRMQEMMGKMGNNKTSMGPGGMRLCYTSEMLSNEEIIHRQRQGQGQCTSTVVTRSPKKVEIKFNCKNGTQGDAKWNIIDDTHYSGEVNTVDAKGQKGQVNYQGTYIGPDCADVRPVPLPPETDSPKK